MLNRCQSMLEFTGLPETIPERNFKLMLQMNGFALGLNPEKTKGKPYMFFGGLGGRLSNCPAISRSEKMLS